MQRHAKEGGYALIMMLGITAALAIMAATIVAVTANTQGATASNRSQMSAFDYAEAGLDSAAMAIRSTPWPAANQSFSQASLTTAYNATYPSGPPLTVMVYDNQATVNPAITWDQGGPANGSTPDGELWVEAQVTVNGKMARMRELVGQVNLTTPFVPPAAAIYTDGNVAFTSGGGNAFAVTAAGTPDTSMSAAILAGGSFNGNWSTSLSPTGGAPTLAVNTNGTVTNPKLGISNAPGTGGVPPLSTKITPAMVATMTSQAQQGTPTQADAGGTIATAALISQLQLNQGKTTNVGYDLVVNGDLTLQSGIANFHSL
ncbi:MAG: hypothetical protein ACLQUT_11640 [Thermoleophilia bacterium]